MKVMNEHIFSHVSDDRLARLVARPTGVSVHPDSYTLGMTVAERDEWSAHEILRLAQENADLWRLIKLRSPQQVADERARIRRRLQEELEDSDHWWWLKDIIDRICPDES